MAGMLVGERVGSVPSRGSELYCSLQYTDFLSLVEFYLQSVAELKLKRISLVNLRKRNVNAFFRRGSTFGVRT